MKATGKKINRMVMVLRVGRTAPHMKGITNKEKNADSVNSNGLMGLYTTDNSQIIILTEKVSILGEIKDNISETGKIIKWMDKGFSLGQI
jgi:hypothetical protein